METSYFNPRPTRPWVFITFLCILIAIVAVPVLISYWPIERAHWLVAEAANTLDLSNNEPEDERLRKADVLLVRAKSFYPEIENSLDFVYTRFRMHPDDVDRVLKLVASLGPAGKVNAAIVLSELRLNKRDFDSAYQILVAGLPESSYRKAEERNQFAYYAALANRDLEAALVDVQKALEEKQDASIWDTKAWVLFRLTRFDEALEAIDRSVKALDKELTQSAFKPAINAKIQDLLHGRPPFVKHDLADESNPLEQIERPIAMLLKSIAVIHYHRGEILETLGKVEMADVEYGWLLSRGFNDFDELY